MNKLLNSQLNRALKSKLLWLCCISVLIFTAGSIILGMSASGAGAAGEALNEATPPATDNYNTPDLMLLNLMPFIGIICAIFTSLFLGTEYSDGTVRNKLIIGHSRFCVYFANLAVCSVSAGLITASWVIGGLIGALPFGGLQILTAVFARNLLIVLLSHLALTAIFVLMSMLFSNKAVTAVLTIMLFFTMVVMGSNVYNRLAEPDMISGMISVNGNWEMSEPTPNPKYVSGSARSALELVLDVLPIGQTIQVADNALDNPVRAGLSAVITFIIVSAAGAAAFKRKDLK